MNYCLEESKSISKRNKTRTLITLKNVIMEGLIKYLNNTSI